MYHVTVYVTLPGRDGLESPTVGEQVVGTRRDLVARDRHALFDVLTVQHDVGGPSIDSELILTARRPETTTHDDTNVDDELLSYSVEPAYTGRTTDNKHVLYTPGGASRCNNNYRS